MSNELIALAERCEAATGPYRELDIAIWRAIDPAADSILALGRKPLSWLYCYTASLDAAMALVPEGMGASVSRHGKRGDDCEAYVGKSDSDARGNFMTSTAHDNAKSMALALTAAALRARAALAPLSQSKGEGHDA